MHDVTVLGVISDTHGLLRLEAERALQGVDVIIHAGDIGKQEILTTLNAIAPVYAIRGNNDHGPWALSIPESLQLNFGQHKCYVIHARQELDLDPAKHGIDIVISGHSHRPRVEKKQRVLYVNPGSAGPRRFKLPVCVARVTLFADKVDAELIQLLN